MRRIKLAVTMGDPAGIGSEIIVKSLMNKDIYLDAIPVVIGDKIAIEDALNICRSNFDLSVICSPSEAKGKYGTIDLIDLKMLKDKKWEYKKNSSVCGDAAYKYIVNGIDYALNNEVDAVITGPISKEALHMAGHKYDGHTEIFARLTKTKKYSMLLASGNLRVVHVSTHVSLREACNAVKIDRVYDTIQLAHDASQQLGISNPRIAVAGLNPHSSENGLFGWEEEKEIIPAIKKAIDNGLNVAGPLPPDTVFTKCMGKLYDIVVAMYHDQGHIPLKLAGFVINEKGEYGELSGINCTIGLPIIRVSVDHGVAFGKAGEGKANPGSMLDALRVGINMAKRRIKRL